MKKKKKKHE